MLKTCNKCGVEKCPTMFSRDRSKRDGYCTICKACVAAYHQSEDWRTRRKELRHREEVRAKENAYNLQYRARPEVKARISEKARVYNQTYLAKPEKVLAKRAYDAAWKAANPDKAQRYSRVSRGRRAGEILRLNRNRRVAIQQAELSFDREWDRFVLSEAKRLCKLREMATGFAWHVDHIVPLKAKEACGLHVACNFAVVPAKFNMAKGNAVLDFTGARAAWPFLW